MGKIRELYRKDGFYNAKVDYKLNQADGKRPPWPSWSTRAKNSMSRTSSSKVPTSSAQAS